MTPRNRRRVAVALGLAGFAALLFYAGRRKGQLSGFSALGFMKAKYRYSPGRHKPAPLVGVTENGGMRTELRSSATMPIEERIGSIQDLIFKSVKDPIVRKLGLALTQHCPERDGLCEAKAIYDHMKGYGPDGLRNYRYSGDIAEIKFGRNGPVEGIDYFQSARRTTELRAGDCDDATIKTASLLAVNGITPRLRVTAESRNADDSHIYPVAGLPKLGPKKWVALDATLPGDDNFGVEMPASRTTDFDA